MSKKKKIIISSIAMLIIFISLSFGVYAIMASTSTRSKFTVNSDTITATSTYTSSTSSFDLVFNQAGDYKEISIATQNSTNTVLHNKYQITSTASSDLFKAILVYLNGDYVGTLNNVISPSNDIDEDYGFIPLRTTRTDTFKFELHQSAIASSLNLNGQNALSITINTYTENANYLDFIYVKTDSDFKKALDDINSGVYATNPPTIILCGDVSLSTTYRIVNPTTIYLNDYSLSSGTLLINDDNETTPDALLKVVGDGTLSSNVTLGGYYDEEAAKELVAEHVKEVIGEGVSPRQSVDLLGHYAFYSPTITAGSYCTYSKPNLSVPNTTNQYYTKVDYITVNGEKIEFKVRGSQTALVSTTLSYLPQTNSIVTNDLFLPTYIPSQNATITWRSSNEAIITSDGRIAATKIENEEVSLYAEIKVNNTIYTEQYAFKVSAHTNEINFYKMVQEISPIVIANVCSDPTDEDEAANGLYHLPIVSQNANGSFNDYDYRTAYTSPTSTQLFNWAAYNDFGIESITYSMTQAQQTAYDYITLSGNSLYLNAITLNNYAQITVTGTFENNETYTTNVNVSISVGSNTQLLEKAFAQISEDVDQINILGNILETRIASGMANEKGDFELSSVFGDDSDYSIEYSGTSNIITSITEDSENNVYKFAINPEFFNEYETTVAFTATVYYKKGTSSQTSKSRTFYVTVPAALHVSDFGTVSIFNSSKYQVVNSLPTNEKEKGTGFSISDSLITYSLYDYVLLRDIVGDNEYISEYANGNDSYLDMIGYDSVSKYAQGTKTLRYTVDNIYNSSTTDNAAYDFVKLIEWATGDKRVTSGSVINNTAAISGLTSTYSNAKDYLNDDEIEVLKAYYQYYTGASDAQWNTIASEILNTAPGYIFTSSTLLNQVISAYGAQSGLVTTSFSTLFGKYMEILQRYAVSTTYVNDNGRCIAPCQDQYNGTITWYHSSESGLSSFKLKNYSGTEYSISVSGSYQAANGEYWYYHNNTYQEFNTTYNQYYRGPNYSGGGDGDWGGFYATPDFESDKTSYITDAELQVLLMFWLNCMNRGNSINSTQQQLISSALTEGQTNGYYPSYYSLSDFSTAGLALINAFYACLEVPTSFTTNGVSKLIEYFYANHNRNSVQYKLKTYGTNDSTTFVASYKNNVPTVTNLDNLKSAVTYFTKLTSLTIEGNSYINAFASEYGLSTAFARTSLSNDKITTLTMNYVANSSVNFDLTNIKNFSNLTYIDLANNDCIQSANELINVNRSKYTHVDIQKIGAEFKYLEFVIDNIASPTCTVIYTENGNRKTSNNNSNASVLANMSNFDEFITKYFYTTNVVYDDSGNPQEVYWRIDEGNSIQTVALGGDYPEISSISAMNQLTSPYFYCKESFTYNNQSLTAGYLYKVTVVDDNVVLTIVGQYTEEDDLTDLTNGISRPNVDFSDYSPTTNITETKDVTTTGSITYQDRTDFYTDSAINNYVTITFNYAYYLRNQGKNNYYMTYGNFMYNGSYLGGGDGLCTNGSYNTYFVFLTSTEATNCINKSYTTSTSIGTDYETAENNSNTYYMCFVYDSELYIVGSNEDQYNTNDTTISVTRDISKALKINLTYKGYARSGWSYKDYYRFLLSTNHSIRINGANRVTYHNEDKGNNWWRLEGTGSSSLQYQYEYNPSFTVRYTDGTSKTINAYAAGYRIKKTANTDFTITQTEQTVFDYYIPEDSVQYFYYSGTDTVITGFDGNDVIIKHNSVIAVSPTFIYPVVSRSRSYNIVGTVYEWELWYCDYSWTYTNFVNGYNDPTGTIAGSLIRSIKINTNANTNTYTAASIQANVPADSSTRTNLAGWDDWNDDLVSAWEYDKVYSLPYISYVDNLTSSSNSSLTDKISYYNAVLNGYNYIYKYTGTNSTEKIYIESVEGISTSYTNNNFYLLTIDSDGYLAWEYNSNSLTNDSGDTMDSILATANTHFKDYQYGQHYGMYYAYTGTSKYISSGIYVKQNYVYRIMPNATNTAFEWVEVKPFVTKTASDILIAMGTNNASVGDIFYSTAPAFNNHFSEGYYRIVLDGKTNIVNLVKYNDIIISCGDQTITQLTNAKAIKKSESNNDYLGYSGTFTIEISAVYRTYDGNGNIVKEYVKSYKIKLVGFLS